MPRYSGPAGLLAAHEHLNRLPAFCQPQPSRRPLLLSVVSLPLACSAPRAAEIFINLDHSRSQTGSQGCRDEVGWGEQVRGADIGTVAYPLPLVHLLRPPHALGHLNSSWKPREGLGKPFPTVTASAAPPHSLLVNYSHPRPALCRVHPPYC